MDRSRGKVRAGCGPREAIPLGYTGSERTTRRAVAEAKTAVPRVHRPWVAEPGCGLGPTLVMARGDGVGTQLFCAWLTWCRFRVVRMLLTKTLPSVMAAIDQTLRLFAGVPTYGPTT